MLPLGAAAECPLGVGGFKNVFNSAPTVIRVELGSNNMGMAGMATSMNLLYQFIGSAGCTTMRFGPVTKQPTQCSANRNYSSSLGGLFNAMIDVRWNMSDSSDFTTGNGCTINCGGNICRVRGADGLPVELLQFSVEP